MEMNSQEKKADKGAPGPGNGSAGTGLNVSNQEFHIPKVFYPNYATDCVNLRDPAAPGIEMLQKSMRRNKGFEDVKKKGRVFPMRNIKSLLFDIQVKKQDNIKTKDIIVDCRHSRGMPGDFL